MFTWSGLRSRRFCPLAWYFLLSSPGCAERFRIGAGRPENPNAGTIQGTVRSEDGAPVESARISYFSSATDTRGVTRTAKDGKYVTEQVPPGTYLVHVDGRDLLLAETTVALNGGAAATVNFKLDWINPGPARLESRFSGEAPDDLPLNGGNYLTAGEIFPGVQAVDGADLRSGQKRVSSRSRLAVRSDEPRTSTSTKSRQWMRPKARHDECARRRSTRSGGFTRYAGGFSVAERNRSGAGHNALRWRSLAWRLVWQSAGSVPGPRRFSLGKFGLQPPAIWVRNRRTLAAEWQETRRLSSSAASAPSRMAACRSMTRGLDSALANRDRQLSIRLLCRASILARTC